MEITHKDEIETNRTKTKSSEKKRRESNRPSDEWDIGRRENKTVPGGVKGIEEEEEKVGEVLRRGMRRF